MSKTETTTLESFVFDGRDGGTRYTIERVDTARDDGKPPFRSYSLTTETTHFGIGVSTTTPLPSPKVIQALVDALSRTRTDMEDLSFAGPSYIPPEAIVGVKSGKAVERVVGTSSGEKTNDERVEAKASIRPKDREKEKDKKLLRLEKRRSKD